MSIEDELKKLLYDYVQEVILNIDILLRPLTLSHLMKANIVHPNQHVTRYDRPQQGYQYSVRSFYEPSMFNHKLWIGIREIRICEKIFNLLVDNNLSPFTEKKYKDDIMSYTSVTRNLLAGLITRIYVLDEFNLLFSERSKERAINELIGFLFKDHYSYSLLVNLHGVIGNISEIKITEAITIKKSTYDIATLFCTYYSTDAPSQDEMYEGDYYLEIKRVFPKNEFSYTRWNEVEDKIIENVHNAISLSTIGNIEIGKALRVSEDWPLINTGGINNITSKINSYGLETPFKNNLDSSISEKISNVYKELEKINLGELDTKILASLKRLRKAKTCKKIEDRIVELALALEYLINTKQYEVTYQMCLKSIKLFNENNKDPKLFKKINDFFSLRGDVVHGKKPVILDTKSSLTLDFIEHVINDITLKIIILNTKYSLGQINLAIDISLYVNDTFENIINQKL